MYVYYCYISEKWNEIDELLIQKVSSERQFKILTYLRESDKKLSLYAALLTRMQISIITSLSTSELEFRALNNHKPKLCNTEKIDFSFSHTNSAILLCISEDSLVGVDIERINNTMLENTESIFHADEIGYINGGKIADINERFLEVWTRKEAYTKQKGTGLVCNLTECNTFSNQISEAICTWKQDKYICSVSSNIGFKITVITITESEIQKYYLGCTA